MVATRGRTFKRPWRRSCLSSKLKSSSAPIGRKDSWCFHAVGSSNAPLLGSTAAEGLPRIGRTSIATRWRSCGLPQSASCCENFVIPPDVFGQTLTNLVAEELEPVRDMHDAGLLRMQTDTELLVQERAGRRHRSLGFLTRATNDDEVTCPARQPIAGFSHRMIKRCEINVRPQRTGNSALRNASLGRLPRTVDNRSSFEKTADQLQNSSVADFRSDQINQSLLVYFVKIGSQVGV